MDPNQTWKDMAQALKDDNHEEAQEHAQNLLGWLRKGGFPPNLSGVEAFDRAVVRVICDKILYPPF